MNDHAARVRKLVTAFSGLSNEGKNALLEQVEALKRPEPPFRGTLREPPAAAAAPCRFEPVWGRTL